MYVGRSAYGTGMSLTSQERAILSCEARYPSVGAAKNDVIRSQLGLSPVRYYQKLTRLIESVEAVQFDPMLVHRLRRIHEQQLRDRTRRAAPRSPN